LNDPKPVHRASRSPCRDPTAAPVRCGPLGVRVILRDPTAAQVRCRNYNNRNVLCGDCTLPYSFAGFRGSIAASSEAANSGGQSRRQFRRHGQARRGRPLGLLGPPQAGSLAPLRLADYGSYVQVAHDSSIPKGSPSALSAACAACCSAPRFVLAASPLKRRGAQLTSDCAGGTQRPRRGPTLTAPGSATSATNVGAWSKPVRTEVYSGSTPPAERCVCT
jgi:hypothetical protein